MAKVFTASDGQNGQSDEFTRFKEAMKVILTVPKDEVLKREKQAKAGKAKNG